MSNNENKILNCLVCGKPLNKEQIYHNVQCCSRQCSYKNPHRKEKMQKTIEEKYGVKHFSQSSLFKSKISSTWNNKSELDLQEINKKIEESNLKKYGCKRPLQNKEIQEKQKRTCVEKYGVENAFQSEEIKEKSKQTCLKRYGTNNARKNKTIQEKAKVTLLNNSFVVLKEKVKEYVIPMFSEKEYLGSKNIVYKWKCVKCGNEFESNIHKTQFNGIIEYIPRCLNCYPYVSGYSYFEKEILNFIKSIYSDEIIENDRKVLDGKELDIYLPFKNLAIEFNGMYWHNSENKSKDYHLEKTLLCEEKGIQLIHIFENEWINKRQIVEDRIKSLLGIYDKKIYARKCEVKEIDRKTCNNFLNENHLQGGDNSSIRYGLFYEGNLISIMTFGKPRFNKKYDFELIRFSSKLGFQIIGGSSKLLRYFIRKHSNSSIISYADRRYSKGNMYEKLGFKLESVSKPNYLWTSKEKTYSRYQCQKHKLSKILGDKFDVNLSETENMILNGFYKIYDCGNLVYTKGK